MTEAQAEIHPVSESTVARIHNFFSLIQTRFAGQSPVLHKVNRAIQPRIEPDAGSLQTLDSILSEYVNAHDWEELPHNLGFISSGEPAGEYPEWEKDWLQLNFPPGAETGNLWTRMVVHRGRVDNQGKIVLAEPQIMLQYYPRGKNADGTQRNPAGMEVIHFSRWDPTVHGELSSVTRVYEEKPASIASSASTT